MKVVSLFNNIQLIKCWRLNLCCRLVKVENVWVSVKDLKQNKVLWRCQEYLDSADYSVTTIMSQYCNSFWRWKRVGKTLSIITKLILESAQNRMRLPHSGRLMCKSLTLQTHILYLKQGKTKVIQDDLQIHSPSRTLTAQSRPFSSAKLRPALWPCISQEDD